MEPTLAEAHTTARYHTARNFVHVWSRARWPRSRCKRGRGKVAFVLARTMRETSDTVALQAMRTCSCKLQVYYDLRNPFRACRGCRHCCHCGPTFVAVSFLCTRIISNRPGRHCLRRLRLQPVLRRILDRTWGSKLPLLAWVSRICWSRCPWGGTVMF